MVTGSNVSAFLRTIDPTPPQPIASPPEQGAWPRGPQRPFAAAGALCQPHYGKFIAYFRVIIRFVEHRIGDQRIIRLIRKWLKAGVLENGVVTVSERGTGQGAVMAPRTQ